MADQYYEIVINSNYEAAKELEDRIVEETSHYGYDEEIIFAVRLSLEEALTNAIRHGNLGDTTKKIQVRYRVDSEAVEVFIGDEGKGFDPKNVPDPTFPDRLECPSGRGIMLMRAYMNEVVYNDRGNEVRLVKLNKAG